MRHHVTQILLVLGPDLFCLLPPKWTTFQNTFLASLDGINYGDRGKIGKVREQVLIFHAAQLCKMLGGKKRYWQFSDIS